MANEQSEIYLKFTKELFNAINLYPRVLTSVNAVLDSYCYPVSKYRDGDVLTVSASRTEVSRPPRLTSSPTQPQPHYIPSPASITCMEINALGLFLPLHPRQFAVKPHSTAGDDSSLHSLRCVRFPGVDCASVGVGAWRLHQSVPASRQRGQRRAA